MGSASGLLKDVDANIAKYPVLVWRWKINRTVGMAVENVKDRNDCSARIRVIFGPGKTVSAENTRAFEGFFKLLGISSPFSEPSGYKIDYIWANRAEKDSIVDYPGSTRHKMIVMESGNEKANGWLWERRDMVGDFKKCFGIDPPGIAGIIVLTDTDQTNEGVEAWYESIVLAKESAFCPE
jgi:hypothetical protein